MHWDVRKPCVQPMSHYARASPNCGVPMCWGCQKIMRVPGTWTQRLRNLSPSQQPCDTKCLARQLPGSCRARQPTCQVMGSPADPHDPAPLAQLMSSQTWHPENSMAVSLVARGSSHASLYSWHHATWKECQKFSLRYAGNQPQNNYTYFVEQFCALFPILLHH